MSLLRVLFIGDAVGEAGRAMFKKHAFALRKKYKIDAVVINGENSSDQGRGITAGITQFFLDNGADLVTTGNHIWYRRDVYSYLDETDKLIRPANFPSGVPGKGVSILTIKDCKIAIINLQGRVFMREHVDDPFRAADSILAYLKDKTNIIFIDMHAEATSEKIGIAFYLAGRVSGIVGTHTHVQTADERILPGGTAYISDLGMVGALNSMLGMQKEAIIQNFLTQLPVKFSVDMNPPFVLCGAFIDVDMQTGRAVAIERVRVVDDNV